jgi:hypothetical protein
MRLPFRVAHGCCKCCVVSVKAHQHGEATSPLTSDWIGGGLSGFGLRQKPVRIPLLGISQLGILAALRERPAHLAERKPIRNQRRTDKTPRHTLARNRSGLEVRDGRFSFRSRSDSWPPWWQREITTQSSRVPCEWPARRQAEDHKRADRAVCQQGRF